MRGAVSVALVYLYYDPDGTTSDQMKSSLISMTLTVVLFSTIVYGAITKPMLDLLLGAKRALLGTPLVLMQTFPLSPSDLPSTVSSDLQNSILRQSIALP
jgi:NhaP-type Na+/H+ or K+/H+ antiporter